MVNFPEDYDGHVKLFRFNKRDYRTFKTELDEIRIRVKKQFEENNEILGLKFYTLVIQQSLEALRRTLNVDYTGIWTNDGNLGYKSIYEAGPSLYINNKTVGSQIRESNLNNGLYHLCDSDSLLGGVDAIFKFLDVKNQVFAYLLLDDIEQKRRFTEEEIENVLEIYHKAMHITLLETELLALKEEMDLMKFKLETSIRASHTDPLTELNNRRFIEALLIERIQKLKQEYRETGTITPVGICISDIDHFKKVNDSHGHLVGDRVLKQVAEILNVGYHKNGFAHTRRVTDHFGRFGGEEFVFVLEDTDLTAANTFSNKIRRIIENVEFANDEGKRFNSTISIGTTQISKEDLDSSSNPKDIMKAVLTRADGNLYKAKGNGRNQVISSL